MAINFQAADTAIAQAFAQHVTVLATALKEAAPDELKTAYDPPEFSEDGRHAVISCDSPKAAAIHEGYTRTDRTTILPQRWTQNVLERSDG